MEKPAQHTCVACREVIKENATVCPHCGTSQKNKFWNIFGTTLKWVGGITAIISLVAGSLQLNSVYDAWKDKQRAVENIIKAARFQYTTGGFETANELLKQASELDPSSKAVLNFQLNLIMTRLREYYSSNNKADWVMTYKLSKDASGRDNYDWSGWTSKRTYIENVFNEQHAAEKLALGAATSSGARKAELLAGMAWLDLLVTNEREEHQIENLFEQALKSDPHNAIVRLMYGGWLLEDYNFQHNPEDNYSRAIDLINGANPGDSERPWFNSLMFKLLSQVEDLPQSEIEMLRLIAKLKPQDIAPSTAADSLKIMASYAPEYNEDGKPLNKPKYEQLLKVLNNDELSHLAIMLGERAFGCEPFDLHCDPEIHVNIKFDIFDTLAFFYEASGQYTRAVESNFMAWLARKNANYDADKRLIAAMERTMTLSGNAVRKLAAVVDVRNAGLFIKGDLVTRLNGVDVYNVEEIRQNYMNAEEGTPLSVTVVRNGVKKELVLQESPFQYARLADYVVPLSFLTKKSSQDHFSKMHASWSSN